MWENNNTARKKKIFFKVLVQMVNDFTLYFINLNSNSNNVCKMKKMQENQYRWLVLKSDRRWSQQ